MPGAADWRGRREANVKPFLLTFDVEEFDLPVELGHQLDIDQQLGVTEEGLEKILPLLAKHTVVSTFFVTAQFARARPDAVRAITAAGHEVACHGLTHRDDYNALAREVATQRLRTARSILAEVSGREIGGLRTPRFQSCACSIMRDAGFTYDASAHPTLIPGRYNGLRLSRSPWWDEGILRVPISVLPAIRLPISWLWYRTLGPWLGTLGGRAACFGAPYLHVYFHPWEAIDIRRFGVPRALAVRTGDRFIDALDYLVAWAKLHFTRSTVGDFVNAYCVAVDGVATPVSLSTR